MAKIIRLPSAYVIDTKVVGVSKINDDGSSRQELIRKLIREDDPIRLEPEPDNAYDPHAVRVLSNHGHQIGYLPRETAERVASAIENEATIHCRVAWTGGEKFAGVGLRIELEN